MFQYLRMLIYVATTPTACGIETQMYQHDFNEYYRDVATTPTACGIETKYHA